MAHALFQVSAKAFIELNDKILVLTTPKGFVDFPGGRLDDTEYTLPLVECLQRELAEELGSSANFTIGSVLFVTKRIWEEDNNPIRVINVFYKVVISSGEISISDEHQKMEWLTVNELLQRKDAFMSQDEYERVAESLQVRLS